MGLARRFDITAAEIRRAYLQRAAAVHPDLAGDDAGEAAAALNRAKMVLENPERRANALLALLGGPAKEQDKSLPPGFLMEMMDTGDLDSKVISSPLDGGGRPLYELTDDDRRRMEQFFDECKKHQGKVTKITGWGDANAARAFLEHTAGFFSAAR